MPHVEVCFLLFTAWFPDGATIFQKCIRVPRTPTSGNQYCHRPYQHYCENNINDGGLKAATLSGEYR
jgi:hypothetical protein